MNAKMIAIIGVVAIAALAVVYTLKFKPIITPSVTVTGEEVWILSEQINSLTEEQLAEISTDLTDFSTTTQDGIASDTSLFMYQ